MTYSEQVLTEITKVADKLNLNLFEATAWYCETLKIEPSELFSSLDVYAKTQIKNAAANGRHVQQKYYKKATNALI